MVQLQSCSAVAYAVADLRVSFNPDKRSPSKSTMKNILPIICTMTLALLVIYQLLFTKLFFLNGLMLKVDEKTAHMFSNCLVFYP